MCRCGTVFAPAGRGGALTTGLFFHPHFSLPIPTYPQMHFVDISAALSSTLIAIAVGMVAVWCLPRLHADASPEKSGPDAGHRRAAAGDPGAAGGHITLFKGLDEMQQWPSARR
jgi:hypothetical protein